MLIHIDGQVRLVRLQTANFRLFLHQQTDKRQTHISMSQFLHVSMSPCLFLHVSIHPSPCLQVSGIRQTENRTNGKQQLPFICCKRKTATANFRLSVANGKRQWQNSVCLLQAETENGNLFSLVCQTLVGHCCFSKRALHIHG
jgi:hypothetical protein